jgi:hypothetical protein
MSTINIYEAKTQLSKLADDFDAPLPPEVLAVFEGR